MKNFEQMKQEIKNNCLNYIYENLTLEEYQQKYSDSYGYTDNAEADIEAFFNEEFSAGLISDEEILELAQIHLEKLDDLFSTKI
jgi:hypothetical protein